MISALKIFASVGIFIEVGLFAYLPYLYPKLHANKTLTTLIGCFTCGLFMGLALLHVLPESNHDIQEALHPADAGTVAASKKPEPYFPYGSAIAIAAFILILAIESYFHDESVDEFGEKEEDSPRKNNHIKLSRKKSKSKPRFVTTTKVILTQVALSIHSFFECMSLGVQSDFSTAFTLFVGIAIHKWAEGLTLGYTYKNVNMPQDTAKRYILFHSCLNGLAVLVGWSLSNHDPLTAGVLSSISAGTFLYVCMIEKLQHDFRGR